jgi:O-acetyl-ADP-ribose deacetylase (regulator of RNase III)
MLSLIFRDLNADVVAAWKTAFDDVPDIDIAVGSILDVSADAIVSPANSFGYMDGGIDLAYCRYFGFELQDRLQTLLHDHHFGELPVGSAVIVRTENTKIPFLISAPTMRVPSSIARSINVYLAFRAALVAALRHNQNPDLPTISTVAAPGMGTGVGEVNPSRAAKHMRVAYDSILGKNRERRRNVGHIWGEHQELLSQE